MEMELASEEAQSLMELVAAMEQATLMAKQLPSATNPCQFLQVCSSFQNAHNNLSSFLARFHQSSSQPFLTANNSVVSSTPVGEGEPMQVGEDDEVVEIEIEIEAEAEAEAEAEGGGGEQLEENSMSIVNKVEERMRDFAIKNNNKRRKLPHSPSSDVAAEYQLSSYDNYGSVREPTPSFDPRERRLRSLDLVFQFHG